MARRAHKLCDLCGRPYYRRSLTETWDSQNPGHRTGWHKAVIRACTTCVPQTVAQRVMIVSTVRAVVRSNASIDADQRRRTNQFLRALERARRKAAAALTASPPRRHLRAVG